MPITERFLWEERAACGPECGAGHSSGEGRGLQGSGHQRTRASHATRPCRGLSRPPAPPATGFTGHSCEENIDDCPGHGCQNGGTCVDGVNTYNCRCPPEWTGRGTGSTGWWQGTRAPGAAWEGRCDRGLRPPAQPSAQTASAGLWGRVQPGPGQPCASVRSPGLAELAGQDTGMLASGMQAIPSGSPSGGDDRPARAPVCLCAQSGRQRSPLVPQV